MNNLINNLLNRNLLAAALRDGSLVREGWGYKFFVCWRRMDSASSVINNSRQKQWTMDCGGEIRLL